MTSSGGPQLSDREIRLIHRLVADKVLAADEVRACLEEFRERGRDVPFEDVLRERVRVPAGYLEPERQDGPRTERIPLLDTGAFAAQIPPGWRALRLWDRRSGLLLVEGREGGRQGILRLFPLGADAPAESWEAFQRYASAYAEIDHPGVPPLVEFGMSEGDAFAIRETYEAIDFARWLSGFPGPEAVVRAVGEAASAADELHRRRLTHGDLRPENVHVLSDRSVVAAEATFGLHPADLLGGSVSPCWAPELLQSPTLHREPPADVFSLGVLLYRGLTGQPPYPGSTREELLRSMLETQPASPRAVDPGIDRRIEAVCLHAIDLDARLRYPNAGEFARQLRNVSRWGDRAASDSKRLPRAGERIGQFSILRTLGEGGMGVIHLARHEGLARNVALKVLKSEGPVEHQRFLQEARILASLEHPNVVRILDVNEADGHAYLAMEHLGGGSLEDRIAGGSPMEPEALLAVIVPVLRGLAHAHGRGIIHRDFKPANILFDEAGTPKLGDFGLAKGAHASSSLTSTGIVIGTPFYISPEAARGERTLTPACDVYSVGAVMYRCLTGTYPHPVSSLSDLLHAVQTRDPPPIRDLVPDVPPALERICRKALARDPRERHPDAGALLAELERAAGAEGAWRGRVGLAVAIAVGLAGLVALGLWLALR